MGKKKKKSLMMNGYDKLHIELIKTRKELEKSKKKKKQTEKKYSTQGVSIDSLVAQIKALKKENESLLSKINKLETENIRLQSRINEISITDDVEPAEPEPERSENFEN